MSNQSIVEELIKDPIGAYPESTVACFDPTHGDLPRRRLDSSRNVIFLERLRDAGVRSLLIAASTGHGHARTVDELQQWYQSSADANLGDVVKMALLRPEDGVDGNRRLVSPLGELGYSVAFIRPGTNLATDASDDEVVDNVQPIVQLAAENGLAVGVYSIPDVSRVALSPAAVAKLIHGPGGDKIVAIKVTQSDYDTSTLAFLRHPELPHLKIVQGWDPFLARALEDGPKHDPNRRQRCGVTSGPMSLAVYQYIHILQAARDQEWDEVARAQQAVTTLFQSMQDDPTKFADLQRAKYIMGLGHPITGTITDEQTKRILTALESLPRDDDRSRMARSLDLMGDGPFHDNLSAMYD